MTLQKAIVYEPIGVIRTPYTDRKGMPIQPAAAEGVRGTIELRPALAGGLKDLDGFSHIVLLYHLHESQGYALRVTPFLDSEERGVFATRAPRRPNNIGLSVVRLVAVEEATLIVANVDMLDGTPLLDIKPYVPVFDEQEQVRVGWLAGAAERLSDARSDGRFER